MAMKTWIPNLNDRLVGTVAFALLLSACAGKEEPYATPGRDLRVDPDDCVEVVARPAPPGPRVSVLAMRADEPATRSRLGEDGLSVYWTAGDAFQTQFIRDGEFYTADFTTAQDGTERATFTTEGDLDGSDFVCIYPGFRNSAISWLDGKRVFDVVLPPEQEAVAGNVAEGLISSVAYSELLEEGQILAFYNLPALLKFRLSGTAASRVREVRISAPTSIAEGAPFYWGEESVPEMYPWRFTVDTPTNSITLSGSFEEGADYYIALWPKVVEGFEMTFSDGEGNYTTRRSSKTIRFRRSIITDFGTIDLGDKFTGASPVSMEPLLYKEAMAGTKPVTIAVIPEGFQEHELPLYERLAKSAINKLFDTEPYKSYEDYFNVYILKVASQGSGANVTDGNGNIITNSGCYFGTGWGANSYGDMRANDNKVFNFVSANCPDIVSGIHTIDEVPIVMVVNDTRYAGRTWYWNAGRSYCMIPFAYSGGNNLWAYAKMTPNSETDASAGCHETTAEEYAEVGRYIPGDWRNIMVHEFGHTFARLADEYWSEGTTANTTEIRRYQQWAVPSYLNVSTSYVNPPWQEFLNRREELMERDPRYGRIGVFQGGATYMYGCWRSERASGMMDNRQYFSAWQRYLIVKRIMTLSGDLASFSFDSWLAKDVTIDPVRDLETRSAWEMDPSVGPYDFETGMRLMGITPVGYPAPPGIVEE